MSWRQILNDLEPFKTDFHRKDRTSVLIDTDLQLK